MDFSSSPSSSQHRSSAFPASTTRPRWDLPIYESTPHFPPRHPPVENRFMALNSQEISSSVQESGRLASSSPSYSSYAYNYSNYNYGGGGASTAGREAEMPEKRDEGGDRPPGEEEVEKEHMFDKVVTPSDVGKLNRLVIPKQHAEKYFPLDSSSSDKGLLLDFEDRNGKSWRFRYSYWNSSQSYVMTKGWSRFVKEKKLDAGDVVSFQRGLGEATKDRFYIDWRRRPGALPPPPPPHHHHIQFQHGFSLHRPIHHPTFLAPSLPPPPLALHHQAWDHRQPMSVVAHPNHHHRGSEISYNGLGTAATSSGYNEDNNNYGVLTPNFCHQGSVVYMRGPPQHQMQMQMELVGTSRRNQTTSRAAASNEPNPMVLDSFPVVPAAKSAAAKRFRLFGVNMDCTPTVDQDSEVPVEVNQTPTVVMSTHSSSSAEEADGSLQLRLHGSGTATATPSSTPMQSTTTDFLDKGKSSMTLDFDF